MEEIYLFSLPVKEYQIVDFFLPKLKDEVMKIMPVQKQTRAGQRTRFKAFVAIGDFEGHVGLGVKCAKEVATAIRGAIILAKLSVIPVRRGYWGAALGEPHTVPSKVSGKVGSVMCRLIPAPRGTGLVAAPASKRLLQLAGVEDCYTQSKGSTATMGNFLKATFTAVRNLCLVDYRTTSDTLNRLQKRTPSLHPTFGARSPYRSTRMMSIVHIYSLLQARRHIRPGVDCFIACCQNSRDVMSIMLEICVFLQAIYFHTYLIFSDSVASFPLIEQRLLS